MTEITKEEAEAAIAPTHPDEAAAIIAAAEDGQLDTDPSAPAYRKLLTLARLGAKVMFAGEEEVARALAKADGHDPDAFHTEAEYREAEAKGWPMQDHAVPIWLRYIDAARAVLAALTPPPEA